MSQNDAWPALLDVLHDALAHALNGRVAGLDGIAQLARIRGGLDAELLALLEDEVRRLGEATAAAAHIPRSARDTSPLTTLREAVDAVVAVNGIRRDLEIRVEAAAESAVVRASEDGVVRCLLLLVRALELGAAPAGNVAVEIVESADGAMATLRLRLVGGGGRADGQVSGEARRLAESLGGTVFEAADWLELRLPRLELE